MIRHTPVILYTLDSLPKSSAQLFSFGHNKGSSFKTTNQYLALVWEAAK